MAAPSAGAVHAATLAAAMAGLQLGMMQRAAAAGCHHMPWANGAAVGQYGVPSQHATQSSRLQHMTTPYDAPAHMQQALAYASAAAGLLR